MFYSGLFFPNIHNVRGQRNIKLFCSAFFILASDVCRSILLYCLYYSLCCLNIAKYFPEFIENNYNYILSVKAIRGNTHIYIMLKCGNYEGGIQPSRLSYVARISPKKENLMIAELIRPLMVKTDQS